MSALTILVDMQIFLSVFFLILMEVHLLYIKNLGWDTQNEDYLIQVLSLT